jgi:hypothetical protein
LEYWSAGDWFPESRSIPFNGFSKFNRYAELVLSASKGSSPYLFPPRVAGEDEGGGLNGLKGLNCLNEKEHD